MADIIFPSKLVDERITLEFEFLDELEWGETIVSWELTASVLVGDDPDPNDLVWKRGSVFGTKVSHQVYRGLPGVIYKLTCTATGSSGNVYEKTGKLAILPVQDITPPLYATFYTTPPYPVVYVESFDTTSVIVDGELRVAHVNVDSAESLDITPLIVDGSLRAVLQSYSTDESLDISSVIIDGTLEQVLVSQAANESLDIAAVITDGTLEQLLVQYTTDESLDVSAIIIDGTLT